MIALSGLFIPSGNEIQAEIEHASRDEKEPGENQRPRPSHASIDNIAHVFMSGCLNGTEYDRADAIVMSREDGGWLVP